MANIRFVVFHTGVDALKVYMPLMEVSKAALAVTNPGARYVVLTDKDTAPSLERTFEVEVVAESGWPLMRQYVGAQRAYSATAEPGLVVYAATDCAANRSFDTALHHNLAITYRSGVGERCPINNIAYVEDHERMTWFLDRAMGLMEPSRANFGGDQESWYAALGHTDSWEDADDNPYGVKLASPEGRWIHLYPCRTHNCFPKRNGHFSGSSHNAYLVHYKGDRKLNMVESVNHFILKTGDLRPDWNALKKSKDVALPMEGLRKQCESS